MTAKVRSSDSDPAQWVAIDWAMDGLGMPTEAELRSWALAALAGCKRAEPVDPAMAWVSLRIVGLDESKALNQQWRDKSGPTNVLSFPAEVPGFLGDIVLCAPLIASEAEQQHKAFHAHFAHLVVHGVLHLRGFDHDTEASAAAMEEQEALILEGFGIINPYQEH